mgnify:CR=1 FL=1
MPCFLCSHAIPKEEACGALEFAGDALAERGRYAVHRECLRPEWRKRFVTREQLLRPELLSVVTPEMDREQYKWWQESRAAQPSPLRRALAQFFAWGSRQFTVEPIVPRMPSPPPQWSTPRQKWWPWRSATSSSVQKTLPVFKCANPGCEQSSGVTGFCMQHQWRGAVVTEPAPELPKPSVCTLTINEAVEALHKHARCCSYDEHFHCAEFIHLAKQYLDMGGVMEDLGEPWAHWNPHEQVNVHSDAFFIVENPHGVRT